MIGLAWLLAAALAESPAPTAKLTCEHLAQPGRVRCEVEARVEPGAQIRWGDVAVTSVPAFVTPLRGRIGPREATVHEADVWRWAFALVARERGAGDAAAKVRVVVCRDQRCAPQTIDVTARVQVGD